MVILILSWTIELHRYLSYANLLVLVSGAWLSFPSSFFCYCYLVPGAFTFFYIILWTIELLYYPCQ